MKRCRGLRLGRCVGLGAEPPDGVGCTLPLGRSAFGLGTARDYGCAGKRTPVGSKNLIQDIMRPADKRDGDLQAPVSQ